MSIESREIELLAPARNAEIGIEAINCGADAVYIGAEAYGARHAAGNSMEDIGRLCDYAHRYGAKVYVTVNTILYDDELQQVRHLINQLHDAGVDALIVQDTALLTMDLPLLLHIKLVRAVSQGAGSKTVTKLPSSSPGRLRPGTRWRCGHKSEPPSGFLS